MRQIETSRTLVFDAPRQARAFFEEVSGCLCKRFVGSEA